MSGGIDAQLKKYREWQKENPEWELCCDVPDTEALHIQWHELSKAERMSWVGRYGVNSKDAFEEFAIKECKVPTAVLCPDLELRDVKDWPAGFCMLVFKTGKVAPVVKTEGQKLVEFCDRMMGGRR